MEEASESKSKAETTPRDDNGRFVIDKEEVAAPKKQEQPAEEPKKAKETPAPAPAPVPAPAPKKAAKDGVKVSVAALVYSERKKNSVSVAVLQDRLADLNYAAVRSDFRGWFHDGTKRAIEKWQKDNGLAVTGDLSKEEDLKFLFDGTDVELA